MKAFVLAADGPTIAQREQPRARPTDVLMRVHACALNRVDLAMAQGHVHGAAGGVGGVLGVEWAGEVAEVGAEVTRIKPGDRVMCSGAGGFAEYAAADWGRLLPVPERMSYEQAAALPVALQTMHDAVVTHGQLKAGDSVLVQGASSGVGLMALRIAKQMGAGFVVGSSTNAERRAKLTELGADLAIDSRDPDWVQRVLAATDGKGVDLLLDQVAGPLFNQNMKATRILGRIVNVGRLGGTSAEVDFDVHAYRRLTYVGVTFRTRTREEVREIVRKLRADLWDALVAGSLDLPIDRVFAFDDVAAALEHMRANRHFGKIVLTLS
jgi:NADPH:quinone reductase-like Zn-dependent oxidoreductase